jgi:hypothetical protein
MDKRIGIIGHVGHGKDAVIQEFKNKGIDVFVIDNIELGGIMAMASMIYMPYMNDLYGSGESRYERKLLDGTDIVKEYGLIQNKQSKLSKWERDMVVKIFEKNYYRVL